jgi:hypothetical protein
MDGSENDPVVFDTVVGEGDGSGVEEFSGAEAQPATASARIRSRANMEVLTVGKAIPYKPILTGLPSLEYILTRTPSL